MTNVTLKEWTDALRSGKYQQGQNYLRINNTFCCLGVLCDLVDSTQWSTYHNEDEGETPVFAYGAFADTQLLPEKIADDLDIDMNVQDLLSQYNDTGVTFAEIADMIDGGLENLVSLETRAETILGKVT